MDGSADSTMYLPPRTLVTWLRAPSDISTARTNAWSPPTRACDTPRVDPGWTLPDEGVPTGVSGPAGLTGGRNLPLPLFFPLRLIEKEVYVPPKLRWSCWCAIERSHSREDAPWRPLVP